MKNLRKILIPLACICTGACGDSEKHQLIQYTVNVTDNGSGHIIFIEDSQNMADTTLERIILNYHDTVRSSKPVTTILVISDTSEIDRELHNTNMQAFTNSQRVIATFIEHDSKFVPGFLFMQNGEVTNMKNMGGGLKIKAGEVIKE